MAAVIHRAEQDAAGRVSGVNGLRRSEVQTEARRWLEELRRANKALFFGK